MLQWYPEVSHFCEGVPLILVATKIDLRNDPATLALLRAQGRLPVQTVQGQALARRIGAHYVEVSAFKGWGVKELFDLALREAMVGKSGGSGGMLGSVSKRVKRKRQKMCTVL